MFAGQVSSLPPVCGAGKWSGSHANVVGQSASDARYLLVCVPLVSPPLVLCGDQNWLLIPSIFSSEWWYVSIAAEFANSCTGYSVALGLATGGADLVLVTGGADCQC